MVAESETQRIVRLTPLADVLASFDLSVAPVAPREEALAAAVGLPLAADVRIGAARPAAAVALRDGYAVRAETTGDATSYAPAPLSPVPPRVDVGDAMPEGADAVAPLDAVAVRGAQAEALAAVAPGEAVLPAGGDVAAGTKLFLAGGRLRRVDAALLAALGVERVAVRQPKLRVVRAGRGRLIEATATLIANAINADSGLALIDAATLEAALGDDNADAIIAIGGTGAGRNDASVRTLARRGAVAFHGIAIAPGETTALGSVDGRPVLLLPGRIDAALAAWVTVGRRMLARLAFRLIEEQPFTAELARKVTSSLGLAEVIPVRRRLGRVEPVASGYLSMQALARSEGFILVPADSEGYAEGARVVVRPWP
jgi:molybdopterin biosynthesis enzyme